MNIGCVQIGYMVVSCAFMFYMSGHRTLDATGNTQSKLLVKCIVNAASPDICHYMGFLHIVAHSALECFSAMIILIVYYSYLCWTK